MNKSVREYMKKNGARSWEARKNKPGEVQRLRDIGKAGVIKRWKDVETKKVASEQVKK